MTLRWLALALALVLAVPAAALILRTSRAGVDAARGPAGRRVEALWVALPLVLLAGLIVLSAQAG